MKKRTTIVTPAAQEIQKQLQITKHEGARKLLESRLVNTYLESFVDLDAEPEPTGTILCNTDYGSGLVFQEIEDMGHNIISKYPQVNAENITIYGYTEFLKEFENTGKPFPKSTDIGKRGIEKEWMDPYFQQTILPESQREAFFDLRDSVLEKWKHNPTVESDSDDDRLEAGEIRIVIETNIREK
jgi:hypothetical protein